MDSWPPRDSVILRSALPAAFAGLLALGGWMLAEYNRNTTMRAEVARMRKDLDQLQVKVEAASAGRFEDIRAIQQKLSDIRVMVVRIESALDEDRRGKRRRR